MYQLFLTPSNRYRIYLKSRGIPYMAGTTVTGAFAMVLLGNIKYNNNIIENDTLLVDNVKSLDHLKETHPELFI